METQISLVCYREHLLHVKHLLVSEDTIFLTVHGNRDFNFSMECDNAIHSLFVTLSSPVSMKHSILVCLQSFSLASHNVLEGEEPSTSAHPFNVGVLTVISSTT